MASIGDREDRILGMHELPDIGYDRTFAHHRLFGPTVYQIATDRRYMWRPGRSKQITCGPCQVVLTSADRRILSMALSMKTSRNMPRLTVMTAVRSACHAGGSPFWVARRTCKAVVGGSSLLR